MATHSSVLTPRIPGTAEPGGLLSMGSHRVGHYWSDLAAAADFCNPILEVINTTSAIHHWSHRLTDTVWKGTAWRYENQEARIGAHLGAWLPQVQIVLFGLLFHRKSIIKAGELPKGWQMDSRWTLALRTKGPDELNIALCFWNPKERRHCMRTNCPCCSVMNHSLRNHLGMQEGKKRSKPICTTWTNSIQLKR